jgi:gas vesicle protein
MRKVFGFVLGAFTGGLLGAAAVILLTPVSGQDMRDQLSNRFRHLQNEIKDAKNQKRAELEGQLQALRAPKA